MTLFELLISLALLALIAGGLGATFTLGMQLYDRSLQLERSSEEIALRIRLRGWLARALPPTRLTPFEETFTGTSDSLTFITLASTPFAPDAAALQVEVYPSQSTLDLRLTTLDDDGAAIRSYSRVLANNANEVIFSYLKRTGTETIWQSSWDEYDSLPELVRIEMAQGSTPDWPEFTVRLELDR